MVHFEMRCHQKIFHLKYHKMKLKRCQICNIRFQAKKTFLTQTSLLMMILKISTDPFDLLIHMENCFALSSDVESNNLRSNIVFFGGSGTNLKLLQIVNYINIEFSLCQNKTLPILKNVCRNGRKRA